MIIPIIYPTAAQLWENNDLTNRTGWRKDLRSQYIDLPVQYSLCTDRTVIRQILDQYQLTAPLRVMVPKAEDRKRNVLLSCACHPNVFPAKAFLEIDRFPLHGAGEGETDICRMLAASPELCFLQSASALSTIELIKYGYSLCSMFMLDDTAEYGHKKRIPLLNTAGLGEFLNRSQGVYGITKARRALRYILDGSNSPRETWIAMLEILPFSCGGFSINGQELNGEIILSDKAAAIVGRRKLTGDQVWREEKVIVEYDSNQTHLNAVQHDRDKRRITALTLDGYKVFPITANMVSTVYEIEKTFLALRKMLGRRTVPGWIEETRQKRRELIRVLKNR